MPHPDTNAASAAHAPLERDSAAAFHVVFMDPPDDAYVATEDEAIRLIQSRLPGSVFTPWLGRSMRAYPDETTRDLVEAQGRNGQTPCSAFVIDLSKSSPPR